MNDQLFSVEGQGIVVTGAASGIGRALAVGFADRGALVTALDVDEAGLASLEETAGEIRCITGDSSDPSVVVSLVADHLSQYGRLDAVFANAGVAGPMKPTTDLTIDEFRDVQRINVDSGFLLAREAIPIFTAAGRGRIIFTSSVWGVRGEPNSPIAPYATSKGAVSNLTRQLAVELAHAGITVNAILPAAIATRIADGFYDVSEAVAGLLAHVPAKRVAGPEAVIGTAVFLASDASEWVTGQLIGVDGGYLAM